MDNIHPPDQKTIYSTRQKLADMYTSCTQICFLNTRKSRHIHLVEQKTWQVSFPSTLWIHTHSSDNKKKKTIQKFCFLNSLWISVHLSGLTKQRADLSPEHLVNPGAFLWFNFAEEVTEIPYFICYTKTTGAWISIHQLRVNKLIWRALDQFQFVRHLCHGTTGKT